MSLAFEKTIVPRRATQTTDIRTSFQDIVRWCAVAASFAVVAAAITIL